MKLYYARGACSLSPHIVLCEGGFDYQLEKTDLKTKKTESGQDYLAINPKGYVPALQLDSGEILAEGPAIVQYLADQKPDARLAPKAGSMARYHLQEMLNFISTEIHKQYGLLYNSQVPEAQKNLSLEALKRRYAYLAEILQGKTYLFGEDFSVADAYLFTVTSWAKFLKLDLSPWPTIQQYQERIAARPAVQRAMKEEGLL